LTHSLPGQPSLRRRLLRQVILPLAFTWLAATLLTTWIANHFVQQAYDRSLLDDALSLAAHIRMVEDKVNIDLSPREISSVLFDQSESVYYAIFDARATLLAGHSGLESQARTVDDRPYFADVLYQNKSLRAVILPVRQPARLTIVIGQTTHSRSGLLYRLLIFSLLPQALLLGLLTFWLRRNIDINLEPLNRLRKTIEARSANDLSALPASVTQATGTRDINQLSESLDHLLRKVKDGIEAQKEFAGNVAHELRTPLAGIRALAEYGLRNPDPAVWQQQLRAITQSQERASHIVDQLLALAFAAEAGQALQLEPMALDEVVHDVLLGSMPKADALGADLGAEGLESTHMVMGHRGLIEGLLVNLIDNALRYGAVAPAKPVVTVSIDDKRANDGRIWLVICDEGPGLSLESIERFKQRWSQGLQAQYIGQGHGLGLDIVRRYALLLDATLEFTSGTGTTDNKGLRVRVGLRAAAQS
jgi:two-component system, OmpR family, sensor histidine kinase TctE